MDKNEQKHGIDVAEAGAKLSILVNEIVHSGIPIPFIVASLELIKHDLCTQHIAMSKQMREIARGNIPPPAMPPGVSEPQAPADN